MVLEAREVGFGGSGRNGGQVIPGLKYDPADLVAKFGRERGERLARFAGSTADTVFDLIARHAMDVPHRRAGWIQGAHTEAGLAEVARRAGAMGRPRRADPGPRPIRDRAAPRDGAVPGRLARRPRRRDPAAELRPRPRPRRAEGRLP